MSQNKIVISAITAVLALGTVSVGIAHAAEPKMNMTTDVKDMQKCYGIAKAGMNDCGTASHSCGSEAKVDRDPAEWIFVPTGLCERIAGGSTNAPKS